MEIALYVGVAAVVILLLVGWFMFAKEHPFLAALIALFLWD
jgi:hypothetical protein